MQIAKKGLFWIVLNVILIPSVFALEWPTTNDFLSVYKNYYGWVDFFLAFMIFASIARLFVEKKFGTESTATKPLYVSLGLVLAIALVTWEVQSGFYLFQLGFVSIILLLILLGVIIYNLIGDKLKGRDSKLDWAHLLFSLLIILLAILLFYPELLVYIPIADPDKLMGYAAAVCGLVALWFLVKWLLGRGKDKEPKGEKPTKDGKGGVPKGAIPGETGTPPTREEIEKTEKDNERIRAYIVLSDDEGNKRNNFKHGERITARVILDAGRTQIKDVKLAWTITDIDTKQRFGVVTGGYFGGDMDTQTIDTAILSPAKVPWIYKHALPNPRKNVDNIINFFVHISNPATGTVRYVVNQKATIESSTEKPEVKKATIIIKDEKNNVGTKFTQGARLAIGLTLEKSNVQIKDLKLEWILKDASTKLNCVFSGKGSGYFAGDKEIIEFDTSQANIGLIPDKSKKIVDIILNIIDPNTNKVLMEKKEDIKILPSGTTPAEEPPEQAGTPIIILKDKDENSPKKLSNASEIVDSNGYKLTIELNEEAKNIKGLKVEWLVLEIDENENPKGGYIPIALMNYEKGLLAKKPELIYSDLLKTIRIKGYKNETNFFLYARLMNSKGEAVKNKTGNVFDYIAIKIPQIGAAPPGPGPSPKGKPREPDEIIPKEKGGEIMSQPPGIITITAEKQNPVAVQRDSTITIENPRAYEIGYAMQKEPPKGTIISFMLADPQTHQMMQLGRGEYPASISLTKNTMPLNNYILQIIFTYQDKSLLADWFNLKVVSALPAAYQVKGLLASGKQEQKTRLNKEDIFAILESKIPEYAKDESTKKLRAGRKPYYPNFREYLEKIYKTGGRPLAVILREKGYEINDKEIEEFITPKLKEYFAAA